MGIGIINVTKATSPAIYLPMNELAGTTFFDASGNGHDQTAQGGVTMAGATSLPNTGQGAPVFNGTNGCVLLDMGGGFGNDGIVGYMIWFKTTATSGTGKMFSESSTSNNTWLTYIDLPSPNRIRFNFAGAPSNNFSGVTTSDGQWHMASVSADGSARQVYLDGVLLDSRNIASGMDLNALTIAAMRFNSTNPGNFWAGPLAHFAVWDRYVTGDEFAAIYAAGIAANPYSPAYYLIQRQIRAAALARGAA